MLLQVHLPGSSCALRGRPTITNILGTSPHRSLLLRAEPRRVRRWWSQQMILRRGGRRSVGAHSTVPMSNPLSRSSDERLPSSTPGPSRSTPASADGCERLRTEANQTTTETEMTSALSGGPRPHEIRDLHRGPVLGASTTLCGALWRKAPRLAPFNVTSSGLTKSTKTGSAYLRRSAVFEHVLEAPIDLQSLVVLRTA
jgi:hypothetical protein